MMDGFLDNDAIPRRRPNVFLQWKGTSACFDFNCPCGAALHHDGDFAYAVRCPHCLQDFEMPCILFPRPQSEESKKWHEPKLLARDEEIDGVIP